jgi:hypothetical protein
MGTFVELIGRDNLLFLEKLPIKDMTARNDDYKNDDW